jgi:hypothetical protein
VATINKRLHQRDGSGLGQGLTARQFDMMESKFRHFGEDFLLGEVLAALKPVNRVAPFATQGAAGQPDERAREAAEGSLTLNARVNLCNP